MPDIETSKQVTINYVTRFKGYDPIDPKDLSAAVASVWGQEGPATIHVEGPLPEILVVRETYQEVPGDTNITFTPGEDQ